MKNSLKEQKCIFLAKALIRGDKNARTSFGIFRPCEPTLEGMASYINEFINDVDIDRVVEKVGGFEYDESSNVKLKEIRDIDKMCHKAEDAFEASLKGPKCNFACAVCHTCTYYENEEQEQVLLRCALCRKDTKHKKLV